MFRSFPDASLYISDKNNARCFDIELGHVKPPNIFYNRDYIHERMTEMFVVLSHDTNTKGRDVCLNA